MAKHREVTVVKFGSKDFGFLTRLEGGDVFIRGSTIRQAGFDPAQLQPGMKMVVQIVSAPKGHEATKVISIEGLEPSSEPVALQQAVVATTLRKAQPKRDRGPAVYKPQFFRSTVVDQDKENGFWRIVKVTCVTTGDCQHHVLFQKKEGGGETSNTFPTLRAARVAVGKVIVPPTPDGHGQPTNVVPIRPATKNKEGAKDNNKKKVV